MIVFSFYDNILDMDGWMDGLNKDDVSSLKGTPSESYMRAIYISRRDITEFFRHAITATMKTQKTNG